MEIFEFRGVVGSVTYYPLMIMLWKAAKALTVGEVTTDTASGASASDSDTAV
ncbi:MAG: hypothetical protein QXD32_04925 [Nitrososphaerota archaeon]